MLQTDAIAAAATGRGFPRPKEPQPRATAPASMGWEHRVESASRVCLSAHTTLGMNPGSKSIKKKLFDGLE